MSIQYPTWRYHKTLPAQIVHSAEEDKALGPGWFDSPVAFTEEDEAAAAVLPPDPSKRRARPKQKQTVTDIQG